jgi:hypothetical protein
MTLKLRLQVLFSSLIDRDLSLVMHWLLLLLQRQLRP